MDRIDMVHNTRATSNSGQQGAGKRGGRMSSEDKSLEASDQGPSPPPDSAGATPTGSPAPTDRRPRGRPRKDVLTPAPKPRKK
ncbi:hypothetical protein JZ751_008215 [Albula glossodonta]|uniref:Uncharacterized protein n=1 Tax=Albula glossodonta TaxID=121402 RepID=A0A8T2N1G1_9TELE|nr:hypothetical protein JZ751_008215 [Albula glossodonta]